MKTPHLKSLVGREIASRKRHEDGRLKLRELAYYKEVIGKKVVDIEEGLGPLFKIVFDDGTYLDFKEDGGCIYPLFGGEWGSQKRWPQ